MKVLAVGSGAWGKNIVRTLNELGALGAVCEENERLRGAIEGKMFASLEEALETQWDAVAIATPASTHFELARKSLLAGCDVFVEKPMTLSGREAEELCDLASRRNRILMVGHLLLYQPAIQAMKAGVSNGTIGQVLGIHQERLNLGRARSVENVLWSLGVHDVAVAQFLAGSDIVDASGSGMSFLTENVEDDYYLHCKFENGAGSHLHCSWLWPERRRQTVVVGSQGMFVYDEIAQKVTLHRKSISGSLENNDGGEELYFEGAGSPLTLEMEHFLHCCSTRNTPMSDGRSALGVVRVLERVSPVAVVATIP